MRSARSLTVVVWLAALAALGARDSVDGTPWPAHTAPRLLERNPGNPLPLGSLGLRFEANVGQSDPSVRFIARYGRATALLTSDALIHRRRGRAGAPRTATRSFTGLRPPRATPRRRRAAPRL